MHERFHDRKSFSPVDFNGPIVEYISGHKDFKICTTNSALWEASEGRKPERDTPKASPWPPYNAPYSESSMSGPDLRPGHTR